MLVSTPLLLLVQLLWVEHWDFIGEMDQKQLKAAVVKLLLALLEGRIDTSVTRVVAQVQKVCADRAWSFLVFSPLTHTLTPPLRVLFVAGVRGPRRAVEAADGGARAVGEGG